MRYLYIDAFSNLTLHDRAPLSLDEMQGLVGGYIENIWGTEPQPDGTRLMVIDNEEGHQLHLAPSVRFPKVYTVGGYLVGPVIIMAVDAEGEQTDLSDAQLAAVRVERREGDAFPTLHIRG